MKFNKNKIKAIENHVIIRLILVSLFSLVILSVSFFPVSTHSSIVSQCQIPIHITLNRNISQGLIYMQPVQSIITVSNYYVINQYGTLEYSYLFSQRPGYLVWYDQYPSSETYYLVYGESVQSQLASTEVFSFYYQFYNINTSIWQVSNAVASGGALTMSGQDSILTENTSATRYPTAVWLYYLQSPDSVDTSAIRLDQAISPGSLIVVHSLSYSAPINIPYTVINPYATTGMVAQSFTSPNWNVSPTSVSYYWNQVKYKGQGQYPNVIIISQGITINGNTFDGNVPQDDYATNSIVIGSQVSSTDQGIYLVSSPYFAYCPELVNGSDIQLLNGSMIPITGSYTTVSNPYAVVMQGVLKTTEDEVIAPVGSQVNIQYQNGSSLSFTVNGNSIYSGFPIPITRVYFDGVGVESLSISPSNNGLSQSYSLLIGFQDYLHQYGFLVKNGAVYEYAGSQGSFLGNLTFPAVVVAGYFPVGNVYYVIGQIVTTNSVIDMLTQSPYTINPTVAYVNYNASIPLVISTVAETVSTALYDELSGIVSATLGTPEPINSQVISAVSVPGLQIVNKNGEVCSISPNVAQASSQNKPDLTLYGFQGYSASIVYGNVQQNIVITSQNYTVNIPQDLQLLIAVDQATRSITITTSSTQVTPYHVASIPINTTNVTSTASTNPYGNTFEVYNNTTISIISYYLLGAIGVISLTFSNKLWLGVFIMGMSISVIMFTFQMWDLAVFIAFAFITGYIMKRLNI